MAERRVKVVFEASVQGYKRAMDEAAASTKKTKEAAEGLGKASETASKTATKSSQEQAEAAKQAAAATDKQNAAMQEVGTTAVAAGALTLAGVGMAVKAYADFDKQMSSVRAATHETAGNMDLLKQAAVEAGAETSFSAVEAAKGIEELAKAGVTTKEILNGGLDGALSLAAAGALDVGEAAEIAASALTQFKLKGSDIPHVADLLAAGAGKAQGSVQDMGAALNQVGLVAAQTGLTIEETTGGLAAFASAGLTGSDAGTSFKTMLAALTPNSEASAKAMEELGISAYDSQGNFIGLSEFAGKLKGSLSGLTDEQRNSTLETIFGSDAVRAAAVLYEQGADGVQKWEDAVNDAGYAAETAALMQDNLAGDLEKLGGAFDTVLLQSGSGANEVLRGFVQGLESVIDVAGQVPAPVLSVATGFAAVLGGAALLGGGLISVIPKIRDTKEAMEVLAPSGSKANKVLSKTGELAADAAEGLAAVGIAAALAAPAMDEILKPTGETGAALEAFGGQAAQGAIGADTLNKAFQDLVQHKDGVGDFQTAIEGIADPGVWGNIDNVLVGGISLMSAGMVDVSSTSEEARDRFREMGEQLATLDAEKAAKSFQSMAKETDGSEQSLNRLLEFMPEYRSALEGQAKAAGLATDDQTLLNIALGKIPTDTSGADGQAKALDGVSKAAGDAKPSAEDIATALEEVGVSAQGTVADLEKFIETLFAAGLRTMDVREATAAHQEAIDGTKDAVEAATKAIEDQLVAEGMGEEAAKALAEEQYKLGGALNKSKTDFDLTSDAGRILNTQFQSVAQTGMAEIEAKAKAGVGQPELQKNLRTTYDSLVTAGVGMGLTSTQSEILARKVMGIPKKANIDTWMSTEAKRIAEQTKAAVDNIPNSKTVGIHVQYTESGTAVRDRASSAGGSNKVQAFATGGRLPAFADGGQLPMTGPGTGVTDGFLGISSIGMPIARVDAGEWIINGPSSERYNRELAAINAGTFPKLPGFASGGREYSAQQLGYTPASASRASGPASFQGNLFLDSGEFLGKVRGVARQEADGAISTADSRSKFMRKGR